jgi:3-oxoacyl-[acyl-carrier-protein] synthase II
MNDPLVIVGYSRIDASTELVSATTTDTGTWVFQLPQDFSQLVEQSLTKLNPVLQEHVHTAIVCSSANDSYARDKNSTTSRLRPKEVLALLGINIAAGVSKYFPNVQNIFHTEAACASGIVALDLADMIARKHNAVVLLAGLDKSTAPIFLNLFRFIGAVAQHPGLYHAPFDQQRNGFAMGEGAALLAVTTASQARARKLDVIATVDAVKTQTIFTHPTAPSDPALLEQFIRSVINESQRELKDFACWDAHATATPQGDELEYQIFANIFDKTDTAISSFKSRVGHCMSASALIEMVNAIEHLQKNKISPNHNLHQPIVNDPRLITAETSTQNKTFIKTSFGFGGRNGAAVITVH